MTVQRRQVLQAGVAGLAVAIPQMPTVSGADFSPGAARTLPAGAGGTAERRVPTRRRLTDVTVQLGTTWRPLPAAAWSRLVRRGLFNVEVPDVSLRTHLETLDKVQDLGLVPTTVVSSAWQTVNPDTWHRLCSDLASRGVRRVVASTTGQGLFGYERSERFWLERGSDLNQLGSIAKSTGVALLYRHGQHEFLRSASGLRVIDILVRSVDPSAAQLSVDAVSAARAGLAPVALARQYAAAQLVLGNYSPAGDSTSNALRDGLLDVAEMVSLCPASTDLVVDFPGVTGPQLGGTGVEVEHLDAGIDDLEQLLQPLTGERDV